MTEERELTSGSGEEVWGRYGSVGSHKAIGCEEQKEEPGEMNQNTSLSKPGQYRTFSSRFPSPPPASFLILFLFVSLWLD